MADNGGRSQWRAPFELSFSATEPMFTYAPKRPINIQDRLEGRAATEDDDAFANMKFPRLAPGDSMSIYIARSNDDLPDNLPVDDEDDDGWKSIIPDGLTPDEYAKTSRPTSPEPQVREPYNAEDLCFDAPRGADMQAPSFRNNLYHLQFYALCSDIYQQMYIMRRYMRNKAVVRARYRQKFALSPPRPKIPANRAWFDWLKVLHEEMMTEHGHGVPVATPPPPPQRWPHREFYERMAVWFRHACEWYNLRKHEELYVRMALLADRDKDARKAAQVPGPDRDVLAAIVPIRIAREISASDAMAPRKLRGHQWWTWTRVAAPPGYDPGSSIVIVSNVDYIPPIPLARFVVIRRDGRLGLQERSRFPDFHIPGAWHWPFIPTEPYGRINLLEHTDLRGQMEFYTVDIELHFRTYDSRTYKPKLGLKASIERYWARVTSAVNELQVPARLAPFRPYQTEDTGRRAMAFLFSQWLTPRHVYETVAGWQRCVAELRGWIKYIKRTVWLENFVNKSRRLIPISADLRIRDFREATRGVFTDDEYVAGLYAQFCIPVWLVQGHKTPFWTADPAKDEVPVSPPYVCERRAYADAGGQPAYLSGIQDYWPSEQRHWPPAPPPPSAPPHEQRQQQQQQSGVPSAAAPSSSAAPPSSSAVAPTSSTGGWGWDEDVVMQDDYEHGAPDPVQHGGARAAPRALPLAPDPWLEQGGARASTSSVPIVPQSAGHNRSKTDAARKRKRPASLHLPKGNRRRRLDVYPPWWPQEWAVAAAAVDASDVVNAKRIRAGWSDPTHPVPQGTGLVALFASPVPEHFAGSKTERNRTNLFTGYVQLRNTLLYAIATTAIRDLQLFQAGVWKSILSGHTDMQHQEELMERLGFQQEAQIVDVDESTPAFESVKFVDDPLTEQSTVASSTRPSSPSSSAPPPSSTAATSRAMTPVGQYDPYDDSGSEPDMTYYHRDGRPLTPEPPRYFRPLLEPCDPPLLLEGQRYEAEPSAWRFKARGQRRPESDFVWWTEDDSPDKEDDMLEFVFTGKEKVKEYRDTHDYCDTWWCYERRWVFIFDRAPYANEGRTSGERLSQPIRLFKWDGSKSKVKFLHDTAEAPVQLRLWHSQSMGTCVDVPDGALGPVGWRAHPDPVPPAGQKLDGKHKWHLDDKDYKICFPTAPRHLLRPQLVIDGRRRKTTPASPSSTPPPPAAGPAPAENDAVPPVTAAPGDDAESSTVGGVGRIPVRALKVALAPKEAMFFNDIALTKYDLADESDSYSWPCSAERALIVWDVTELSFRLQLFQLDDKLRVLYPDDHALHEHSNRERQLKICDIWGSDTFVPHAANPLTDPCWEMRIAPVLAFYNIVSSWPRAAIAPPPQSFGSEQQFLEFEQAVWSAYARVHASYLYREAAVPLVHPNDVPGASTRGESAGLAVPYSSLPVPVHPSSPGTVAPSQL